MGIKKFWAFINVKIQPQPLFDTLENLNEAVPTCVSRYLANFNHLEAEKTYQLSLEFLKSYAGSQDTFNAYRREVEKFLQWLWITLKKSLPEMTRHELRDYLEFCQNPPAEWIGLENVQRFKENELAEKVINPAWRPFVAKVSKAMRSQGCEPDQKHYQLKPQSLQSLLAVLSTYFTFLMQENYLISNPVQLIRQKKRYVQREQTRKVTRKLSHEQWNTLIDVAERLAEKNPLYERSLFALSAFYLLGLRISELADTPGRTPKMGDFAPDKNSLWWFTTVGKGNKVRDVAVPDAMLNALKRFRNHLNLTPLPMRDEPTPLLPKLQGSGGLGTRQLRKLIQQCFDAAIFELQQQGKTDEASDLANATVHWLRHTAISADVEWRPREHVRDDAGHESATTTDRYIDVDRAARHASARKKTLRVSH